MQKLFFTLLLALVAFMASAQTATQTTQKTEPTCLEERPEWTATADAQTIKCERSAAKVQVKPGGQHWPVFRDIRTDDVFALVYVDGKGYHRVILPDPTLAKAD